MLCVAFVLVIVFMCHGSAEQHNNNNNRYRIACYSIELNASVDYMKPSFAIKSMNHCIFNRELDTG